MSLRPLNPGDADAALRFVLMAAFPPDGDPPDDAVRSPHVCRWIDGWGNELGMGWEEAGELVGAAWARRVEPAIVRAPATGEPLPELVISVDPARRGAGIGRSLMEGLLTLARQRHCRGLSLTVSDHNRPALRLYRSLGFDVTGHGAGGLLVMAWRPGTREDDGSDR